MTTNTTNTYTKPQPVLVLGAITTSLTVIFGGLATVAGLQDNKTVALIAGVGALITAGINAGKDFYLKGMVTPAGDVAAYRNEQGVVVSGAAAGSIAPGTPSTVLDQRKFTVDDVMTGTIKTDSLTAATIKPASADTEGL